MNEETRQHIVLIGLMGTGKTTIGRQLAKRLVRPFVDTDQLVQLRAGRTVREIFATDGESRFRDLEAAVISETVESHEPSVIAAAGGSVMRASSRTALARCEMVVWLDGSIDLLVQRTSSRVGTGHRPLIDDDPRTRLTQLRDEREEVYRELASHRIQVDDRSISDIVATIVALHSSLTSTGSTS